MLLDRISIFLGISDCKRIIAAARGMLNETMNSKVRGNGESLNVPIPIFMPCIQNPAMILILHPLVPYTARERGPLRSGKKNKSGGAPEARLYNSC
jgi:hypothetical protein